MRALLSMTSGKVVNADWTYEFALGATHLPNRNTVVTAHDAPFTILRYQQPRRYFAVRAAMAVALRLQAPMLTAVSPYLAAAWQGQMLYRRDISVVPNVVPIVASKPPVGGRLRSPTILEVADSGKRKNVAALLRAMPGILECCPGAKLRLVGEGLTDDSSLARLAQRLGIADRVEFAGKVRASAMDAIYSEADIFVHPSLEESFSMSVAEAMSHALPIVAGSRSGGVPWVLNDGRAGLLVDIRNPVAIADSVTRMIADPALRRELATAAQARVRSHLSPEAVAAAYLEIYARAEKGA